MENHFTTLGDFPLMLLFFIRHVCNWVMGATPMQITFLVKNCQYFLSYVVGAQKNPQHMFWLRNKEMNI